MYYATLFKTRQYLMTLICLHREIRFFVKTILFVPQMWITHIDIQATLLAL